MDAVPEILLVLEDCVWNTEVSCHQMNGSVMFLSGAKPNGLCHLPNQCTRALFGDQSGSKIYIEQSYVKQRPGLLIPTCPYCLVLKITFWAERVQ